MPFGLESISKYLFAWRLCSLLLYLLLWVKLVVATHSEFLLCWGPPGVFLHPRKTEGILWWVLTCSTWWGELSRLGGGRCLDTSSLNCSSSYGHQLPFVFFPGESHAWPGSLRALLCGSARRVPVCRQDGAFRDTSDRAVPAWVIRTVYEQQGLAKAAGLFP